MRGGDLSAGGNWFVGRVSELAAIGACVDAVSGGAGRVVWIEGDPGSGKTALVSHVVAELPAAFVVLRAAADESAADQPFALLEQFGIEGGGKPAGRWTGPCRVADRGGQPGSGGGGGRGLALGGS